MPSAVGAPPAARFPAALRDRLATRLAALPFPDFLTLVARLLMRLGYEDVQPAGRTRWRGRNTGGGFDLSGVAPAGLIRTRMIAQVKHYGGDRLVYQRSLDELRGACLRVGASQGLLVTTSGFSPVAAAANHRPPSSPLAAPLTLIAGQQLVDLLLTYQVGIRRAANGRWTLEEPLERAIQGEAVETAAPAQGGTKGLSSPHRPSPAPLPSPPVLSRSPLTVTIRIGGRARKASTSPAR